MSLSSSIEMKLAKQYYDTFICVKIARATILLYKESATRIILKIGKQHRVQNCGYLIHLYMQYALCTQQTEFVPYTFPCPH